MDDDTKRKMLGAGKIAYGTTQVVSGCFTAVGKGIIGGFLKNHGMMQAAIRLGKYSVESGSARCKEGMDDIRD